MAFLLAASYALINYIRGRGYIPYASHVIASLAWGLLTGIAASFMGYDLNFDIALFLITFAGMLAWMVGIIPGWGGWGLYFASWTWEWNPDDSEVPPIDWLGYKLVPFVTPASHWTNGLRGVICMSLRGLYLLPLFWMLEAPGLGVIVGLSQGLAYGIMHWIAPDEGTEYAEPFFAAIIGAAVARTLVLGY